MSTEEKRDLSQSESDGNAGFLRAARDGNLQEVLEYLKGSTDINTSNPNGLNALHLASKEGHLNIVTELLRRGANVEAATKKGNTALHIASLAGHENIVKILVENGAHVNLQAQAGFTPLYMAAQEGHSEVVRFLLTSGGNQSLATEDGFTPLAVALQQGHDKVVSVLLEHDTKGKVRLPALHIAAKKDDVKSAALLLQNEQNNVDSQTKSGFTPLHIASHYGNTNVSSLLIQRGADVNFKAKNNITPLHVASRWGKSNMVQVLLDYKAIIDEKTRDGLTPLHCAARSGHEAVVDLLLEREAPHSSKTKNGLTPLHMAAQGDHVDCARLLLYHKANVDEVTVDYLTPLHVAAHCGNVKTAKLLLDRKCEPNARALNGFTPLHIACKKNRIKVVELLLKYGASIEATTESGLTPLHVASFMGHMNIVIYLIQHNANPDTPTVRGETSLHLAARANQTDIIRILLRNGATVDAKAREQQTPLHIASRLGNVDNVVLLLQHGANADATTKDKYTPLHIAAKEGHDEVAQVLLENGASHDVTTKKGFTPLHIAAKYGNIKVARLLLQKDANPDVQGKNGLTPLHVATHYNHVNVAQLLLENKANPHATAKNGYTPLHIAAKKNQMDIATALLEYGAKPNAESKNGFTPLHLASQEGHTDVVSLLLEKDANVNARAHNGLTPMHLAAQEDKVPVAEILAKYEAEIDPQTKAGYTPLHTACHFGQINMVRFLLDHDASVSATTKVGYTPLHQAAQQGHVQVVNLLLKNGASANTVTNNGQTPLAIAQKLGYISVVEMLKPITQVQDTMPASEDKYKVVSPETMQETFISDSEDEGGSFYVGSYRSDHMSLLTFGSALRGEDSISLERGGSISPLNTSFDKDVVYRYPASDPRELTRRGREVSEIGAAMYYPSYLDSGPDYEAEMRYFQGDTLSPRSKQQEGSKAHNDSVFGDTFASLGRDSLAQPLRSVEDSIGDYDYDDDLKYVSDDAVLKKDYMEAQQMSQSFTQSYSAAPPRFDGRVPSGGDQQRFSSYSGSSFSTTFDPDNVPVDRSPVYSGFLISFMVDARGGAMRGCRHSGVRVVIPPKKCSMPTRVTCRLIKKEKLMKPPPMSEGEGLAARILEMGPVGTQFLGPIIMEIPHYASLRGKEREVVVMRSDNGESWYEHPLAATEEAVSEALGGSLEDLEPEETLQERRITRILTTDFPQYFALVTRVKQEGAVIGYEGGVLSSTVVPQVQAVLPEGTLTKPIKVGLQAQPVAPELVAKLLGNRVAVSPIVTVEPRRRKFHKPITLTIPVPKAAQKGMINQYGADRPTLRLLYSLAADPAPTNWEDITDNKPITLVNDCVSFTTSVSARFWLIDCQNISEVTRMASALYHEAISVPYMAKFVVFGKRTSTEEGRLRMFCMTDDKVDKTLEKQEKFVEIARSRDIEVLEGRPQYVEMAGNLIPMTKSGDQLHVHFKAFRENRLPSTVKVRDPDQDAAARVAFMKEPKLARGEAPQVPVCNLNIRLPDTISSSSSDVSSDTAVEIQKRHSLLREQGIVLEDRVTQSSMNLSDVADNVQGDWVILAQQLGVTMSDINRIKTDYSTLADQALAMLQLWVEKNREKATGNALESALQKINREDVVKKCMYNTVVVSDEVEAAAARVAMDQSGFDTFKEEVGISKDSMKRGMSLDVQYDEQDMIKESESAEESSPGSERTSVDRGPAPQAIAEVSTSRPTSITDEVFASEVDERRPVAMVKTPEENEAAAQRKKEAFMQLAQEMDRLADLQEGHLQRAESEERESVREEDIVRSSKEEKTSASPPPPQQDSAPDKDGADDARGVIRTPPPSPTEKFLTAEEQTEEYEEERVDEFTEIVETFQSSEDGGKTWKTYKKTITITPEGTSERVELIEDAPALSSTVAAEAASRLSSQPQPSSQAKAQAGEDDGQTLPVSSGLALASPGQGDDGGLLSDQFQSPMSEGSYKEGPASVPEPSLPEDFLEEEEQYQEFGLRADLGDEGFVDRKEETVAVVPQQLSPEEIPDEEPDFKVTMNDYSPAGTRKRIFIPDEGQQVEHEFPEEDEDMQQMQETTTGVALQFSRPKALSSLDSYGTEQESVESIIPSVQTSTSKDIVDRTEVSSCEEPLQEEAAVGSTTQTVRSTFIDDYHRTEIEISEKETVITDRTVVVEECTTMSPFSQEEDGGRMHAAPAEQDRDDADMGLPERSLFSTFDTNREEVLQTEKEERHVEETHFEQFESQGTRQHFEEEDFVEAHEVLPTELDSVQAAGIVTDTTFDQEESLQPSFQKPDQETVLEDFEQEGRHREVEDDISQTQQQPASSGVDLSDEKEQESTEVEAVHRPDQYIEKDAEDYFETEEHTKEDEYPADLAFESEQRGELDGSEKHEAEEPESEHFSEASDEMLAEQTEESVGGELQVKQTTDDLPDAATTAAEEESDHQEAEATDVHFESEDAVCPSLEAERQIIEEKYELSQAAHTHHTEQLEQVGYEGPDTSEVEAYAEIETEKDDDGKFDEETASAFKTAGSEEQKEPEDTELIVDFKVTDVETPEDKPPCSDSQWTEEAVAVAEQKDEDKEIEREESEQLSFDTGAEVADDQDEEWEILDKAELTEEEQIAAMDETLMVAITSQDEQSVTEAQEATQPLMGENLDTQHDQTVQPSLDEFLSEKSDEEEEKKRETESVIQDQPLMSAEEDEQSQKGDEVLETENKTKTEVTEAQELEIMTVVTTSEQISELSYEIREQTEDMQKVSYQQEDKSKQMLVDEERMLEEEQLKESEALLQKKAAHFEEPEVDLLNFEEDKPDQDMKESDEEEEHHEEKIHSEALLHAETHVFEAEGFTREIDDTKSPAMSQSTGSTEAQMLSSEEALFATSSQPEAELMPTNDMVQVQQRPDEEQYTEAKLHEQSSDDREEELEPLKLSGTDSPTMEPVSDTTHDSVDQSDRPEQEALEPQLSPTFGESSDQQVHRSPLEEEVETQPREEMIGEDAGQSIVHEKQSELFEEETEIEQVAVSGILAEIQGMEQYAGEEESEEEGEDGLEQYEEEPCQQQTDAPQQPFETQDRFEEDQAMRTDDMGSHYQKDEELEDAKDQTETFQADIKFSAESQEFVDRVESFSLEERDTSIQHTDTTGMQKDEAEEEMTSDQYVDRAETFLEEEVATTEMKEEEQHQRDAAMSDEFYVDRKEHIVEEKFETTQADKEDEDEQDNGFSADMYVDRTERFVEEPVDTLESGENAGAGGTIPEVTGMESAVSDSEDQQPPAQKDSDTGDLTQDVTGQQYAPPSPDEPRDSSQAPSGMKVEEPVDGEAASTGFTYSYTSQETSVSHSYASQSTASHGVESDFAPYTKAQEAAMTGYEFKQETRMSEEIVVEQTFEGRREEYRQTELYEEDLSERPMSPSEYTLITSQAGHPEGQTPDVDHPEEQMVEEEGTDRRESPSDQATAGEEAGWGQPPSPTEYTLVSSGEQEALTEVLGLPPAQDAPAAVSAPHLEKLDSQESGEEALIQFSDSTDAAAADLSGNQHVEKGSDPTDDLASHIEPSAPDMSPSSETKGMVRSSSYENLYQNISAMSESPFETETALDLDIGDRFDTRHTEPHLKSVGRTSSFEDLYDAGITPPASAPAPAGGEEVLGAEAAAADSFRGDEDRASSASSDAARLDDMEDGATGPEDRSIRTDEEESGDDNIDAGLHGDEEENYTHRVVMKKEVHQKTTIKADGQEETVITEDSQVHQDSDPPEDLRQSMEEIIQHFMHDSPQMPRVQGVDADEDGHGDEGTEV